MLTHDYISTKISEEILNRINNKKTGWKQVFTPNRVLERKSTSDWPSPDFIHIDVKKNIKCAYEFKPPNMQKGEYIKGLGQVIAYRQYCDHSILVIPSVPLGDIVKNIIINEKIKVGLITYKPSNNIDTILQSLEIQIPINNEKRRKLNSFETAPFWAYYRDASFQEIFIMLKLCKKYESNDEESIKVLVFNDLFSLMTHGKTETLKGKVRKIKNTKKNRANIKKNYSALFTHLNLWESDGRLTESGRDLLFIGETSKKENGYQSVEFINLFCSILLITGKHLRLMDLIDEYQNTPDIEIINKDQHLINIELFLEDKGFIKRNPKKGKEHYKKPRIPLQDEIYLWNHLGLVINENNSPFSRDKGFTFDYQKVLSIIIPQITMGTARKRIDQ